MNLSLKGVAATFVAPVGSEYEELNDLSAVLRLVYGKNSFLTTGDAELDSIKDMLGAKTTLKRSSMR